MRSAENDMGMLSDSNLALADTALRLVLCPAPGSRGIASKFCRIEAAAIYNKTARTIVSFGAARIICSKNQNSPLKALHLEFAGKQTIAGGKLVKKGASAGASPRSKHL